MRCISAVLALVLVFPNDVFGIAESGGLGARSQGASELVTSHQSQIPLDLGTVDETYKGTSDKTIYYIQDAHDSLEAQENIARIIRSLVKERGVRTVFEEGFEGTVPTDDLFGFMTDKEGKEAVSYFLLDRLRLGAAEYAHINRTDDFKLIGIDPFRDYLENVRSYQKSSRTQEETNRDLNLLTQHMTRLSSRYFPKEMKEGMKLMERFDSRQLPLADYIFRLVRLAGTSKAEDGKELTPTLNIFVKYLNKPTLSPEESKDLEIQLKAIDAKTLFKEIEELEIEFSDRYLITERDRAIFRYLKTLLLLTRLNHLELTPEEYEVLGVGRGSLALTTQEIAQFLANDLKQTVVLSKRWEENIRQSVQFYELAHKRDAAMPTYLDSFLQDKSEKEAVLVFGGFHKTAITERLKKKGISYYVISPKITKDDPVHHSYYRKLMSQGYYSYEMGKASHAARAVALPALTRIIALDSVRDYTERLYSRYLSARQQPGFRTASVGSILAKVFSPPLAAALLALSGSFALPALQAEEPKQPPVVKGEETTPEAKIQYLESLLTRENVSFDMVKPFLDDPNEKVAGQAWYLVQIKNIPFDYNKLAKPHLISGKSQILMDIILMIIFLHKISIEPQDLKVPLSSQSANTVRLSLMIVSRQSFSVDLDFMKPFLESPNDAIAIAALDTVLLRKVPMTADYLDRFLKSSASRLQISALEIIADQKIKMTFEEMKPLLSKKETVVYALNTILANRTPVKWDELRSAVSIKDANNYAKTKAAMLQIARDQKIEVSGDEIEDLLSVNQDSITEEAFKLAAAGLTNVSQERIESYFDYRNEGVAVAALQNAALPNFPLKGAGDLRFALEHRRPAVVKATLNVIRVRDLPVTFDLLGPLLNYQDQGVRDEVRELLKERKISIPPDLKIEPIKEAPKEKKVGITAPVPNDVSKDFRISSYIDDPKVEKVIYIDARNIEAGHFTPEQIDELYAYGELQKKYLKLVIYNTIQGASLGRLEEVVPPERVVRGDINKAVEMYGHLGTNIQLSAPGIDPIGEANAATAERTKFFRYQKNEVGLVTVALLYAELDKIDQALAGIDRNPQGYFYVVGETLERLTQEYAKSLLVAYSA